MPKPKRSLDDLIKDSKDFHEKLVKFEGKITEEDKKQINSLLINIGTILAEAEPLVSQVHPVIGKILKWGGQALVSFAGGKVGDEQSTSTG